LINVLTFCLYVIDKRRAISKKFRIKESILLFFTLVFGGIGALLGMLLARHKTKRAKFRIAVTLGLFIALIPVVHIIHGLTFDKVVQYVEIDYLSNSWPSGIDGYRIAFMSDIHTTPHETMDKVAVELNMRNIDLLILGGDFAMQGGYYQGSMKSIAQITAPDGIFGVDGNHDDYMRLNEAMRQHGITPLDNDGIRIHDGFYLAGVQDMWNRSPDIKAAVSGADTGDFILLVSHNPDVSMVQPTEGVDLILSGHTHNGQISFFGIPLYLLRKNITNYGMHFAHGFAESADGIPVYTSKGIGDYYTVPRIFSRPEVVIFTMRSEVCE